MKIQIYITSMVNSKMFDISEIVSSISWTTSIDSQPGKLDFTVLVDSKVFPRAGDIVHLKVEGKNTFRGKVFNRTKNKDKKWKITAYDNTRYLKNEDTLVFPANSLSSRFVTICKTQGLPHKVLDTSYYNCPAVINDKHTYYSMLEEAIEVTRKNQKVRYAFWDNYGTLELFDLNRKITKLVIGDNSLLTDYDYSASIDDAANSVKVMREDKDKKTRQIFTATHAGNIAKWGKLQVVETATDADMNSSQLQNQANVLLREHNKETKTISLDSIGNMSIRAGNSFILRIADLQRDGIGKDSLALVKRCTHQLGSEHTMSLDVEVVA
ncbi:hypothetical protein QLI93_001613 [Listeria monocytogenes]|nr:hypothetical protein [Listeria monocytogenes]